MSDQIRFFVVGTPATAGSKNVSIVRRKDVHGNWIPATHEDGRIKLRVLDDSGERGQTWRADVREEAMKVMEGLPVMEGPLYVELHFRFPRNKGHYSTAKYNFGQLKAGAPIWHFVRPDIDKVSRAVLDALKGIVWSDDNQVSQKFATKRWADSHYGEREGVSIMVRQIGAEPAPPVDEDVVLQLPLEGVILDGTRTLEELAE
jgi:Holliday junction resolvase RusA-like endonuclease